MSITINKLNADLLRERQLNLLAGRSSKHGRAFFDGLNGFFNFRNSDTFFFLDVGAGNAWKRDWLVDTGLDGFRVGNLDGNINGCNNGNVVSGFLSNFLAVLVAISLVSMTVSRLADSDHLNVGFLLEGDFNGFGSGVLISLLVVVGADLIGDFLNGLGTDSTCGNVAVLFVNNGLNG
uniref:Uncharacterized protein n=1 Tax=Lepeophtheirus salmonis TaxID=72036 RepID=A7TZ98_LEPSM|nr:hypothetical protein [Lepeophtheirus salmonis]